MSDTFEAPAPSPEPAATPADTQGAPAEITADAAPADIDDDADDTGAEQPEKPRGGFQKRISELTEARRRAEREADFLREQLTRAAPQPQAPATTQQAPQLPPDVAQWLGAEPKPSDFPAGEFDPNFTRAAARYDIKVEQAKAEVQRRAAVAQQQQQQFWTRATSVLEEAKRSDPAVSAVLSDDRFPLPPVVVRELMDCEAPAKVLAFLGKNPDEARRIAELGSPTKVARALDRIESRLTATPPVRHTSAPPPPTLATGRSSASPDLSKMSMEQYVAARSKA